MFLFKPSTDVGRTYRRKVSSPAILPTQVTLRTALLGCNYLKWVRGARSMKNRRRRRPRVTTSTVSDDRPVDAI
jgi:hypothetical protein